MDEYWVNTTLTVIGEGFGPEESDDIAGIVVNIKKGVVRIAIWTKSSSNEQLQLRIGGRWKETANINSRMEFIPFKDSISGRGKPRASYVIE